MKTNIFKLAPGLLAVGLCISAAPAFAQTSTTVTTSRGAFTEYVPNSETMVVRSEAGSSPLRYTVTKQTTIVDESGAPVALERISPGSPLSIQYSGAGDRLVASRIIVQRPATATTVTSPVTTGAPVAEEHTSTTTTTTRPLTHEEKHAIHEEREHRKHEAKEEIEREKDALDKAKDKLDDDD
ncbi:MAG: hypothetical protein ACJ8M1_05520 [Chthoniobacterales bacterium]